MSNVVRKVVGVLEEEADPVLLAVGRARVGAPLSDEERQAREESEQGPWVEGRELTAELARSCAGE